jgi:hypothetical protein
MRLHGAEMITPSYPPALLFRTGAPHGLSAGSLVGAQEPRLPTALVLIPVFNRKTSSRPMSLPPLRHTLASSTQSRELPTLPVN